MNYIDLLGAIEAPYDDLYQGEPIVLPPHQRRPIHGDCPYCGADDDTWCYSYCSATDPIDYSEGDRQ